MDTADCDEVAKAAEALCEALLLVLEHTEGVSPGAVSAATTVLFDVAPLVASRASELVSVARRCRHTTEDPSSTSKRRRRRRIEEEKEAVVPLEKLREALAEKDALIATYTAKFAEWRRDFAQLRADLSAGLDN